MTKKFYILPRFRRKIKSKFPLVYETHSMFINHYIYVVGFWQTTFIVPNTFFKMQVHVVYCLKPQDHYIYILRYFKVEIKSDIYIYFFRFEIIATVLAFGTKRTEQVESRIFSEYLCYLQFGS